MSMCVILFHVVFICLFCVLFTSFARSLTLFLYPVFFIQLFLCYIYSVFIAFIVSFLYLLCFLLFLFYSCFIHFFNSLFNVFIVFCFLFCFYSVLIMHLFSFFPVFFFSIRIYSIFIVLFCIYYVFIRFYYVFFIYSTSLFCFSVYFVLYLLILSFIYSFMLQSHFLYIFLVMFFSFFLSPSWFITWVSERSYPPPDSALSLFALFSAHCSFVAAFSSSSSPSFFLRSIFYPFSLRLFFHVSWAPFYYSPFLLIFLVFTFVLSPLPDFPHFTSRFLFSVWLCVLIFVFPFFFSLYMFYPSSSLRL